MTKKKHIYTVSELNRKLRIILEEAFPQIWVEGEISNFTKHTSGHMYFSLKDSASLLPAVLFRNVNKDLKFKLENGMQVICLGRISVYERRGQYQLYVDQIEPKGIGALGLAFEQLKERLAKEGLFDQDRKRALPFLPRCIGVVTSPTGAAIRDILKVLKRRFANLEIILNPVRVQGEGAASEIAQAIDDFNQFGKVDVLIVGRGGGSLEDLWAFNEEIVARAIYRSHIPVISAVGHEIDYTISDFVADLRAPTPSAAAEQAIARKEELIDRIDNLYSRTAISISGILQLCRHRLEALQERYVFQEPSDLIQQYQQRIDELTTMLETNFKHIGEIYRERYNVLIGKLHVLSPLNILSRGYSITLLLPERKIVKEARNLKTGARLETQVARGSLISKVEKILE